MRAPCKDCPDRHPICHDSCPKYQAYRAERMEAYRQKRLEREYVDAVNKIALKALCRKWKRDKGG